MYQYVPYQELTRLCFISHRGNARCPHGPRAQSVGEGSGLGLWKWGPDSSKKIVSWMESDEKPVDLWGARLIFRLGSILGFFQPSLEQSWAPLFLSLRFLNNYPLRAGCACRYLELGRVFGEVLRPGSLASTRQFPGLFLCVPVLLFLGL